MATINIRLNKNFTTQLNRLMTNYGEEFAKINGLSDAQLNFSDFIDNFIDAPTVADASVDGNANVAHKDIITMMNEMPKAHQKLLALNKLYYEMNKKYGFTQSFWAGVVLGACANKEYGRTDHGKGAKYNVEFVSANPTGPMHMGNARGGALGDCLAAVLDWSGYDVTREFYINDAGNQIQKFGKSLAVRYLQKYCGEEAYPLPAECYQGGDIKVLAGEFAEINGDKYVAACQGMDEETC